MSDPEYIGWLVAEAYAAQWIFVQLGYTSDDVFIGVTNVFGTIDPPGACAVVQLKRDGRELTLPIGRVEGDDDAAAFLEGMRLFIERDLPALPSEDLTRTVKQSEQYKRLPEIVSTMAAKGWKIRVPKRGALE